MMKINKMSHGRGRGAEPRQVRQFDVRRSGKSSTANGFSTMTTELGVTASLATT